MQAVECSARDLNGLLEEIAEEHGIVGEKRTGGDGARRGAGSGVPGAGGRTRALGTADVPRQHAHVDRHVSVGTKMTPFRKFGD